MSTKETAISKVVIIGPESTGKSTLCALLAQHYQTLWCPEYAREYLQNNGANYTYDDLLNIAKGQLALQEKYSKDTIDHWQKVRSTSSAINLKAPLLFVDTDMHVMQVWSNYVFGKVDPLITNAEAEQDADLYFLMNIDLEWTADVLREYPDIERRQELFDIYEDLLKRQPSPWVLVQGEHEQRLQTAIQAVDLLLLGRS